MKILAIGRDLPDVTDEQFAPLLKPEAARAWELVQAGIFREIYFRADEPSAVIMLECADTDEARQILATLPLVEANLIAFDLIPLKAYPGFVRLFADPG
jgi:muconolactone delta-isomerase